MSISIILLIAAVVFILPAILIPENRLRFYTHNSLFAAIICVVLMLIDIIFKNINFNQSLGKVFYPLYSWFLNLNIEMPITERYHISAYLTYLIIYGILYLFMYIMGKVFFLGTNPNIHKSTKTIRHIINIVIFVVTTYGFFAFVSINIRELLPFKDGFLAGFFNLIYWVG